MRGVPFDLKKWKSFFFTIWGGQVFSLLGSAMVDFALIWHMTVTTGSATVLAAGTIVKVLPQIVLGPIIGGLVDRWKRRTMIIFADGLIAVFTLLIMALFWSGRIQIWHIYILLFVRSMAGIAHYTAMFASTSLMVPEEQLTRVAGLNQVVRGALGVVGPPLGAFFLGIMPIHTVLFIDVITAVAAILPLVFILIPEPTRRTPERGGLLKTNLFRDIAEGFQYVRAWRGLLFFIIFIMVANTLVSPAFSLVPLLITDYFKGGVAELGWVEMATGIGLIAGSIVLSIWGGFKKRILTWMTGVAGAGLSVLLVAFAPQGAFWLGAAGFFLFGCILGIVNAPVDAILQAKITHDMQGRVLTLFDSVGNIVSPLALAIAGPLTDLVGVRVWFFGAGFGLLLLALIAFNTPVLMNLEENGQGNKIEHVVN